MRVELLALWLAFGAVDATLKCAYDLGSNRYQLAALERTLKEPYLVYRGATSFSFNVCGAAVNCGANLPAPGCKKTSIGGMETSIASLHGITVHKLTRNDVDWMNRQTAHKPAYTVANGGMGVKMVFQATHSYGAAGVSDERMTIMIPCDSSARYAIPLQFVAGAKYETAAEGYIFVLPSIYGCPTNKPLPDMAEQPMSFGWIFIILLAVVSTVYCGVGIGYKMHVYGVRGEESIPHIEFWRELPHLCKDGLVFFIGYVRECDPGKKTPYDSVM